MKFELKNAVVVASMALMGAAQAANVDLAVDQSRAYQDPATGASGNSLTLNASQGVLTFSTDYVPGDINSGGSGLLAALNAGSVKFTSIGSVNFTGRMENPDDPAAYTFAAASAGVTKVGAMETFNASGSFSGYRITDVYSSGGLRQFADKNSTLSGGYADVTNLHFDLQNNQVKAMLDGHQWDAKRNLVGNSATGSGTEQVLWTFSTDPSAPLVRDIPVEALLASDPRAAMAKAGFTSVGSYTDKGQTFYQFSTVAKLSNLQINNCFEKYATSASCNKNAFDGFRFFAESFGLTTAGKTVLNGVNTDTPDGWGSISSTINFTIASGSMMGMPSPAAVPEAGSLAMMALGLLGVAGVARRRRA